MWAVAKSLIGSSCFIAALYLVLAPRLNSWLYRRFLFHTGPEAHNNQPAPMLEGIQGEEVWFMNAKSKKLSGWFFKSPDAKYTILFSHGNANSLPHKLPLLRMLLSTGASVLIYDYQGFGKSEGQPSVQGIIDDARAAYAFLSKECGIAEDQIVFYGESLGAAVSAQLSKEFEPKAIILQSGFTSLSTIGKETLPWLHIYPNLLFPHPPLDTLNTLRSKHAPLLIIHGVLDQTVPFSHGEALFKDASSKKEMLVLKDSGHADIVETNAELLQKALNQFISAL